MSLLSSVFTFLNKFFNYNFQKNIWFFKEYILNDDKLSFKYIRANLFASTITHLFWLKARFSYYLNNWVYTTNHKRIAINYFWFVILSGIIGLVLATLIRLEMAYPGSSVLAGDSLQYLTIVSAHGVIMVFFMIIPLLFGAYSNFLLPTQLGVHDVAFPRLNSAAFWFLPAGLIMLGQMVCIDRRYQRMNCFNVREYESLLKRKFFYDLVNSSDYRLLINKTSLNLRYKLNESNLNTHSSHLFGLFGLKKNFSHRQSFFFNSLTDSYSTVGGRLNSLYIMEKIDSVFGFNLSVLYYYFSVVTNFFSSGFFLLNFNFTNFNIINFFNLNLLCYSVVDNIRFLFLNNWFVDLFNFIKSLISRLYFSNPFNVNFLHSYIINTQFGIASSKAPLEFSNYDKSQFYFIYGLYRVIFNVFSGFFTYMVLFISNLVYLFNTRFYIYKNYNNPVTSVDVKTDATVVMSNSIYSNISTGIKTSSYIYSSSYLVNILYEFFLWVYLIVISPFVLFWNMLFNASEGSKGLLSLLDSSLNYILYRNWYVPSMFYFNQTDSSVNTYYNWSHTVETVSYYQFFNPFVFVNVNFNFFLNNLNFLLIENLWISILRYWLRGYSFNTYNPTSVSYSNFSNTFSYNDIQSNFINSNTEDFTHKRFTQSLFPVFKMDFKSGVYLSDQMVVKFSHLINTHAALVKAGKLKPLWFYSDEFTDNFLKFATNLIKNTTTGFNNLTVNSNFTYFSNFIYLSNFDIFFFFWNSVKFDSVSYNKRWVSITSLNQKFINLFLTASSQNRVYNNWRQLKFTREAWRCRLLVARHQKSLYRRYVNNDRLLWSIERNAKDLLPGWAMVTPFSSRIRYTLVGKTDIGLFGVFLSITSSMINSMNFLITYRYLSTLNNRKMRDAKSFFTEGIIVASWMIVSANPMLGLAILMLISDRHWRTSFFDYSGGGDTVLFQHMFWFFGHPEVYIIMIPCFGFVNTIMSFYLRKRISARTSLVYSMYTIAFLGFFVWGHHMYMVGLAHTTRMLYSTLTVMISVPAATKIMHWLVTFVNSTIHFELPILFVMVFIFLFLSGGISGMAVAHTGMDVLFHDTLYVVGHFHVMLSGSAIGACWAAFYFYFPALFGVKYSRLFAYLHFIYYYIGHIITFLPLLWLGYAGMPRRVLDYPIALTGWHSLSSAGHVLSIAGVICFFIMLFDSIRRGKAAVRNTFGVGRYNTRLNFYMYEINRLHYIRLKTLELFRLNLLTELKLNKQNYFNFSHFETTLFYYKLKKN